MIRGKLLSEKEFENMMEEYDKVKYKCECGHRVIILKQEDKKLCRWCGKFVFKNKEDEFKYRLQERLKKNG